MKIAITGSRSIKSNQSIEETLYHRLDDKIKRNWWINVGDATGIDWLVQLYLNSQEHKKVCIWYTNNDTRNMIDNPHWTKKHVEGGYRNRDVAMLKDSDELIAVWDNVSPGTKRNFESFDPAKMTLLCAGINISSDSKGLGGALTINDKASFRKGKIKSLYPVLWENEEFGSGIDIWKREDIRNQYLSCEIQKEGYEQLELFMRDIMLAKFLSNPVLYEQVKFKGGVDFLRRCTHIKHNSSQADKDMWEGVGYESLYILCLIDAYYSAHSYSKPLYV